MTVLWGVGSKALIKEIKYRSYFFHGRGVGRENTDLLIEITQSSVTQDLGGELRGTKREKSGFSALC